MTQRLPFRSVSHSEGCRLWQSGWIAIDVRNPKEFELAKLPESINVPWYLSYRRDRNKDFSERMGKFANRKCIVLCQNGNRSKHAARELAQLGLLHPNSVELDKGLSAWLEHGLPVTDDDDE